MEDAEVYYDSAEPLVPKRAGLAEVREAAMGCRACHLWRLGTQTVFGEGSDQAKAMFVGEQPGDKEDLAGRPFVGPAGKLLDKALEEAGIDRGDVYITNVVKHFKWEPSGNRRIHKKPNRGEIESCRPWLDAELERVQPKVLVCLGATAAQALLGASFKLTQHRGEFVESGFSAKVLATLHPAAVLRMPGDELRERATREFFDDMKLVARQL
ncbi:MAG TPA: UdgX family uracil-DNA binding protein [Fimbriimonas sp.]